MSDAVMPPTDEVGSLLADRERLQGWLARLDHAVGSAPDPVRQRVRADYEQRLGAVVTRLGAHVASLSASLAAATARLATLQAEHSGVEEALAEAELRHAVGEYPDAQWEELSAAHGSRLDELGALVGTLTEETTRTSELLAQITPDTPSAVTVVVAEAVLSEELPVTRASVERALQVEVDQDGVPVFERPEPGVRRLPEPVILHAPLEAPKFTPSAGAPSAPAGGAGQVIQFPVLPGSGRPRRNAPPDEDELAFLRSVTTNARPGAGAARSPAAASNAERTLQCADCGAMNPPNEWYCDQCGGELSAV